MKKILVISVLLCLTLSVFAAGKTEEGKAAMKKEGTITLWTAYPDIGAVLEGIGKRYMEANPGVEVKITVFAARALEDKSNTAIPAGVGPDIVQNDVPSVKVLIDNGHFSRPPDKLWDFYQKSIRPVYRQVQRTKDEFWGMPVFSSLKYHFWNVGWFKEVGLTKAPETLDEMVAYARKLTKYDAAGNVVKSGISLRLSGGGFGVAEKWWNLALHPYGGSPQIPTSSGKFKAGLDSEASQLAVKIYIDMLYKYKVDSFAVDHDTAAFAKEVTAQFQREGTTIPFMQENAPKVEYGIAPLPGAKINGCQTGGETMEVTEKSKNKALAWDFVMYCLEPDYQRELFVKTGWLPVREDVDYEPVYKEKPKYKELNTIPDGYQTFVYFSNSAFMELWGKAGAWLTEAFTKKELMDNPAAIKKSSEDFNKEANEILKEAGQYSAN